MGVLGRKALERFKLRPIDVAFLDFDNHVVTFGCLRDDVGSVPVYRVRQLEIPLNACTDFVPGVEQFECLKQDEAIVVVS